MASLSLADWASENILPSDHDAAFGTYCSSRDDIQRSPTDPSHLLNQWFIQAKYRHCLLTKTSALLCRDGFGALTILSSPRMCIGQSKPNEKPCIIASRGNSLRKPQIVSISKKNLHRNVIGILPGPKYRAMESTVISKAADITLGFIKAPVFKTDGELVVAHLPTMLPLEFGHGIDEDMPSDRIVGALAARHPYYADWIEATGWLHKHLHGNGLNSQILTLPNVSHGSPSSSVLISSIVVKEEGSQAWIELYPDLDRIRRNHVETWLRRNQASFRNEKEKALLLLPAPFVASKIVCEATFVDKEEPEPTTQECADDKDNPLEEVLPADSLPRKVSIAEDRSVKKLVVKKLAVHDVSQLLLPAAISRKVSTASTANQKQQGLEDTRKGEEAHAKDINQTLLASSPASIGQDRDATVSPTSAAVSWNPISMDPQEADEPQMLPLPNSFRLEEQVPAKKRPAAVSPGDRMNKRQNVGTMEAKILLAMAELNAIGMLNATRIIVAMFSGYANDQSKSFADALKTLVDEGLVTQGRGCVSLTDSGLESAPADVKCPRSNKEMHERLFKTLSKSKKVSSTAGKFRSMWAVLADGEAHSYKDVASKGGYTNVASAGFKTFMKTLEDLGWLHTKLSRKNMMKLDSILFPFNNEPVQDESVPAGMIMAI